ncbi:MAG TPA: bifunctional [glutamate--ammonia ligase]-adenylyl-L-tyrosine phosphorylase/[glutamate--ammonia-ligase] adenylyltransferase [Casimicrobiaceae bacterium]|nr:bifunctional [glutamate--ammonia ligase]-adenylyl-L-tyrosine phosphorylase/[glutamate--ammonia-ligase] adenylyltransferase [Casimicrobiaceae bacterium]
MTTPTMDLQRALAFSAYPDRAFTADAELRDELAASFADPFEWSGAGRAVAAISAGGDAPALARALRRLRTRVFLHTLARDLAGRAPFGEVVAAMSTLAEVALRAAVDLHTRLLAAVHGTPTGAEGGTPQSLIVIGMGKLGGGELNVSSDVDLVFAYPEEGETDGARPVSNREFFDRLGRRVISAIADVDGDGYVFRVDMRLRPYGDSGPLTVSFAALEQYLVTQGRAWERYAWLKARPLTGDRHGELAALVTPFVYRKYLDYDAYEGLRGIHRQIREQERRRDYADDIKLGPGGIREIEFIVQALQIVRGGREPALRLRGTLPALAALAERQLLAPHAITVLEQGYLFLRKLEHRLQYRDDRQTQHLPVDAAERERLAAAMGFDDAQSFDAALARHRHDLERQFAAVFDTPGETAQAPRDAYATLWDDPQASDEVLAWLADAGFDDPATLVTTLKRIREGRRYLQLPALSRERVDRLVPMLLAVAAAQHAPGTPPSAVVARLLALLEAVSGRSAYLALLVEHPPLLPRLAQLMGASAWAADYLTRHPLLLDELLDARVLLAPPDWSAWRDELSRLLVQGAGDAEASMDALRHFQHAQTFRLLAQDLSGQMSVERLADHLSALADTILEATIKGCWRLLQGPGAPPPRFAIVGYGKLGGKELGYASDLDLVFLYEADPDNPADEGAQERYARLGQRINTWLTSATAAGRLYETDLRLRPDGAAGLMVSSLAAFERYQREQAWTWEHQALTRARFVAGDAAIGTAFESIRDDVLRHPRDTAKLAADVIDMRARMATAHANPSPEFDLKHDRGGMVDIEFVVQYLVLAHAHRHRELTRNAGNIALLSIAAQAGLLPADVAQAAADAYREYRRLQHQIRLTGAPHARVDPGPQSAHRAAVDALWEHALGPRPDRLEFALRKRGDARHVDG